VEWVLILAHFILHLWVVKNLRERSVVRCELVLAVLSCGLVVNLGDIDVDATGTIDVNGECAGSWSTCQGCSKTNLVVLSFASSVLGNFS